MIRIRVKTTWNGQVAVRNKYIEQALRQKEELVICVGTLEMRIPPEKIQERIRGKRRVPDNFSKEIHTLYYFVWDIGVKPDKIAEQKQSKLF